MRAVWPGLRRSIAERNCSRFVDLLALHLADHVAFAEDVAGGRDFLHAGDDDAGGGVGDAVGLAKRRRQFLHRHAQLVARRRDLVRLGVVSDLSPSSVRSIGRRVERAALAVADHGQVDLAADRQIGDVVDERAVAGDGVAVGFDDDVARLDAGLRRRQARLDGLHERAARIGGKIESGARVVGQVEDAHAEVAARHLALPELRQEALGGIDRSGEAEALRAAAADGGVDADHFAVDVHQRAARIAEVDGGVGLDEVLERAWSAR